MELKEGIYIRVLGQIRKIIKFDENILHFDEPIDYWGERETWVSVEDVIKFKGRCEKNIIDLIEEGDYVNGCKVVNINYDLNYDEDIVESITIFDYSIEEKDILHNDDIKSIVTKEQFESISYRVKE